MFDISLLRTYTTPFYYYDINLLRSTLTTALNARPSDAYCIHYAIKANPNPEILRIISSYGLGADCVSLGEMRLAIESGFPASKLVMAGVGKSDEEIEFAIENDIECLNVESIEELEVISEFAKRMGKVAKISLRVNPDIDAHTHKYITTGLEEDKFGIDRRIVDKAVDICVNHPHLRLVGLHFHIGSQILILDPFKILSQRINAMVERYNKQGIVFDFINVGGGLGVDYDDPDSNPIADFKGFFDTLNHNLDLRPGQKCFCELGRSIVAQCGSLISTVRFVKHGIGRKFIILDAGMNDLIRPALYQAHHAIQNLTSEATEKERYDVVGPICESDDCFAKDELLPITHRGDLIAIRTAGAYGESMASCYNTRPLAKSIFAD